MEQRSGQKKKGKHNDPKENHGLICISSRNFESVRNRFSECNFLPEQVSTNNFGFAVAELRYNTVITSTSGAIRLDSPARTGAARLCGLHVVIGIFYFKIEMG